MNYELALALKDAGFPLVEYDESLPVKLGKQVSVITFRIDEKEYFIPTLSELIEACGEELRLQSYYQGNDLMWQADNSSNFIIKEIQVAGIGSTPEEAVANLWLELNK